jgi:hypothetical protein
VVTVRILLYGTVLSVMYRLMVLICVVFLCSVRVHSRTGMTTYEALDATTSMCIPGVYKEERETAHKAHTHSFVGVFIRYTDTTKNAQYIDLTTGLVKTCGHTAFDEVWYCTQLRPPAVQLLYDLGLVLEANKSSNMETCGEVTTPLPPCPLTHDQPLLVSTLSKLEVFCWAWGQNKITCLAT